MTNNIKIQDAEDGDHGQRRREPHGLLERDYRFVPLEGCKTVPGMPEARAELRRPRYCAID